jgi:hypothetical protein
MIKTLRVGKEIAQPHGMCQPFSMESRWIEIHCGGQIPSNLVEDFVGFQENAASKGEVQRKKP